MDTKHLELIAEDYISSRLQQAGLLVAKLKFEQLGTDLLVFNKIGDGVKFCRVQCKGRSVAKTGTNVKIPERYVTNGFIVVLYVAPDLYCFFANDVKSWKKNSQNEHTLGISKGNYQATLVHWLFDPAKTAERIKDLIEAAEIAGEFRYLTRVALETTEADAIVSLTATAPRQDGDQSS